MTQCCRAFSVESQIGPRGAIQLAGALRQNKSLTELDLRENSLGPKGMKAIADALAENDTVRILHLQVCCVSCVSLYSLLTVLFFFGAFFGGFWCRWPSPAVDVVAVLPLLCVRVWYVESNAVLE